MRISSTVSFVGSSCIAVENENLTVTFSETEGEGEGEGEGERGEGEGGRGEGEGGRGEREGKDEKVIVTEDEKLKLVEANEVNTLTEPVEITEGMKVCKLLNDNTVPSLGDILTSLEDNISTLEDATVLILYRSDETEGLLVASYDVIIDDESSGELLEYEVSMKSDKDTTLDSG